MTEGDILLVPLPQSDGQIKNRPAILLRAMPPFGGALDDTEIAAIVNFVRLEINDYTDLIDADFVAIIRGG